MANLNGARPHRPGAAAAQGVMTAAFWGDIDVVAAGVLVRRMAEEARGVRAGHRRAAWRENTRLAVGNKRRAARLRLRV